MDLFALGTPVVDEFAKATDKELARLGARKGATNYFPAARLAFIERLLRKKIAYRYAGDNARNVCEEEVELRLCRKLQPAVQQVVNGAPQRAVQVWIREHRIFPTSELQVHSQLAYLRGLARAVNSLKDNQHICTYL